MFNEISMEFNEMKILIVDDDTNSLVLINHILKERYIVDIVNDSRLVMEKLTVYRPDLILMDIMMPGISGLDLCRQLQEHPEYYTIPVILITAKSEETDVFNGLEAGAIDYIKKPFSELELIARINAALKTEIYIRKLKMLIKLKDSFLSMVSHDIKTPLTAIMGFSELLLEERVGGNLNEKQKRIISQILDSANHQNRIIKDLLNYSILESGNMKLFIDSFKLKSIINKSIAEVSFVLEEKQLQVIVDVDDLFEIECDMDRIIQVLTNLLANAVKFTPKGGIIELGATKNDLYAEVFVKDSGIGIPKENIQKIFDEYELFTTRGTSGEKGTGLGVNICNRIIKEHGGTMFVQSEEGKGTTFFFTLPYNSKSK